jgi:hypothetical protein
MDPILTASWAQTAGETAETARDSRVAFKREAAFISGVSLKMKRAVRSSYY